MSDMVWMLIENDGAVLLAHRKPENPPFADEWVLPGTASAQGESAGDTLARMARDDFDVALQASEFVESLSVPSGGADHAVDVYRVGFEGTPKFRESGPYQEVGWAEPEELDDMDFEVSEVLRSFLDRMGGAA